MNYRLLPIPAFLALAVPAFFCACSPSAELPPGANPEVTGEKMILLQQNFDQYDTNNDGFISRAELHALMVKLNAKDTSDKAVTAVMNFYDFNRDGKISLRESQSGAVTGPEELLKKAR